MKPNNARVVDLAAKREAMKKRTIAFAMHSIWRGTANARRWHIPDRLGDLTYCDRRIHDRGQYVKTTLFPDGDVPRVCRTCLKEWRASYDFDSYQG